MKSKNESNEQNGIEQEKSFTEKLIESALKNYKTAYVKLETIQLEGKMKQLISNMNNLTKKSRRNPTKPGKISCDKCDLSFASNRNLKRHLQYVHSRVKNFHCEKCDSSFYTNGDLTRHVRGVHLKLKPYSCDQCDLSFLANHKLDRHKKTVHLNQKPISCQKCEKSFGDKGDLKRHFEAVHLKQKSFQCPKCENVSLLREI